MNGFNAESHASEIATVFVQLALNGFVQSTFLIGLGLLIGFALRGRGSAVQSAIYRTTLAAVVACPIVGWLLSAAGISGWSITLPQAWVGRPAVTATDYDAAVVLARTAGMPNVVPGTIGGQPIAQPPGDGNQSAAIYVDHGAATTNVDPLAPLISGEPRASASAGGESLPRQHAMALSASRVMIALCVVWLTISLVLLGRLASAWRRMGALRRGAIAADADTLEICSTLAAKLGVDPPRVLRSPYLPSPCLAGFSRPVILLPEAELSLSMHDVLTHELAHLKRHDCLWNLLGQLTFAVWFVQPLVSRLLRRLEMAAEEVCDDYVVQMGGNRQQYANRLVDIAELSTARIAAVGLGVVSLRSMLARRVVRILDTTRSLSTRVGNMLMLMLMTGGLVCTAMVGLLAISPERTVAEPPPRTEARGDDPTKAIDPQNARISESSTDGRTVSISGKVADAAGNPIAGAAVAVIAHSMRVRRAGDFTSDNGTLAEATTDANGQYQLKVSGANSQTYLMPMVVTRAPGLATAWRPIDLDVDANEVSLQLAPEELIHGKLIDIEGQPAGGVRLSVRSIQRRSTDKRSREGAFWPGVDSRGAWPEPLTSDAEGRFAIHSIPPNHEVLLHIDGDDRFATQDLTVNLDLAAQRESRDRAVRPTVKNSAGQEEITLALAPVQPFEGSVRCDDTGEPIPHARLSIWAAQQEFGTMISVEGQADDKGHFRITPYAGIRFGIIAYSPDNLPYLGHSTPSEAAYRWEAGESVKHVDVRLQRGVLVRGTVTEAGTNAPVAGCAVQFIRARGDDRKLLTGWQGMVVCDDQGRYSIAVTPDRGHLLFTSPGANDILQETSPEQLYRGRPGGLRYYAHAIERIDPKSGTELIDLPVQFQPGKTIVGRMVDESGQPIDEALVISRLNIAPHSLNWRGNSFPVRGGRFELPGTDPSKKYNVCFLDAKRRLGATAVLQHGESEPTIVLKPCGQAKVKIVTSGGQPNRSFSPNLQLVITPGPHPFDAKAMKRGELAADCDFVANVDQTNYGLGIKADDQAVFRYPALIPGATYWLATWGDGDVSILKEFSVKPGEELDLGEITIDPKS